MLRDVAVAGCVTFFDSTPGSEKDYRFNMTFGLFLLSCNHFTVFYVFVQIVTSALLECRSFTTDSIEL